MIIPKVHLWELIIKNPINKSVSWYKRVFKKADKKKCEVVPFAYFMKLAAEHLYNKHERVRMPCAQYEVYLDIERMDEAQVMNARQNGFLGNIDLVQCGFQVYRPILVRILPDGGIKKWPIRIRGFRAEMVTKGDTDINNLMNEMPKFDATKKEV